MNYEQALEYIHGTLRFGSKLGLENIRILLELMGNPQKKLNFIHVAGTNGKGSTTAMISQIMIEAGYRVGMYTSPYIEEFTERIQVNGVQIDKQHLADITDRVKQLIGIMVQEGHNHPTEFEVVTAIAFQYYYDLKCDYVVLEVGLGGRFDATNVIEESLISVITSISMDHMEWLGDSIGKIAFEKCGIIKKNGLVVVYPEQEPEAQEVIEQIVLEKNADMMKVDGATVKVISHTIEGITFDYNRYKALKIRLLGEHQVLNAITAITTVELLNNRYQVKITEEHIRRGLEETLWPGRLEVLSHEPLFLIDGAHNMAGVRALVRAMKRYACNKKIILIIGMLRDKEYEHCLAELGGMADTVIITTPLNNRAAPADELGHIAKKYCSRVYVEHQIEKAIVKGIEISGSNNAICCCGSLYLIGEVRKIFKETYK